MPRDPRLDSDVDFIDAPKFDNSIKKLLERYPNGVPETVICRVMKLESKEVRAIISGALEKLRAALGGGKDE